MKLTIQKTDLHRGLSRLQAVVEKRNSMPILANVLLSANGRGEQGRLELVATDLEVGLRDVHSVLVQEAGNTTTLAHYLELLAGAGMVTGLQKFAGDQARQRGSSPKLQVRNTALMTAQSGLTPAEARADGAFWGRLVESAVGAHLANAAASGSCEVHYWRDRNREIDFVVKAGRTITAIEVKSTRRRDALRGMDAFSAAFHPKRKLLVGGDGIAIEDFLGRPVEHWVRG